MEAFQYAIDLGYRYLETDVHVTSDGVLVAFHDNDLQRTCGRPGKISELPWSEVSKALVDGKAPIPQLEDLIGAWPQARINIDCKTGPAVDALIASLRRTNSLRRVCVAAFSDLRLLRFGLLRNPPGLAAQVPVKQGPMTVVNRKFVERSHRLGLQVHVWTIDDAPEMERLLDIGVDGIMTDRPAILRQVLESRGAWHS